MPGSGDGERYSHNNLDYLYFSLFPEFSFGKWIVINLSAGAGFAFLLYSHEKGYGYDYTYGYHQIVSKYYTFDAKTHNFNPTEFRIYVNVGIEIPINKKIRAIIKSSYSRRALMMNINDIIIIGTKDLSLSIGVAYKLNNFGFANILPKHIEKKENKSTN